MDNAKEHVARFGVFFFDVCFDIIGKCAVAGLVTLHYLTAALAYNNYMVVFVNNIHES